ncbi:hypothetical protein NQ315_003685 [Exocentrus adspersus]|uniref:Gag protein n=1 Tax=Exocentrus adspersus TaxID=1586481 RepID=A0AAV8VA74_9CUCU|nr:hypothetical protein NQ315_003685 [Exocentrus adspersus]
MAASNKFDEFSGDQDWQIYAERLEQYFVANKIEDDKLQVATLLSVVGVETYKLLRNLCHPDAFKHNAKQEVAEPVAEWYARLRSLAINCDFKTRLPEVLKDKFVAGLNAGPVLDKVCELEDNRTLDDILKLALQKKKRKSKMAVTWNKRKVKAPVGEGTQTRKTGMTPGSATNKSGHVASADALSSGKWNLVVKMEDGSRGGDNTTRRGDHADRITYLPVESPSRPRAIETAAGVEGQSQSEPGTARVVTESGLVAVHYDKPSGSKTRNIIEGNKNVDLGREIAGKRSEQNARQEATAQGGQSTSDINKRSQRPIRRPKKLDL